MSTLSENHITLTEPAFERVLQLIKQKGDPSAGLRIYIIGGGCSGFQYGFKIDTNQSEDDLLIPQEKNEKTLNLLVDELSMQYLQNAEVHYEMNLQGSRFVVNNPNADTTCGCGSSFSLKEDRE
jgi:iron-sulfur cluster insertion protein